MWKTAKMLALAAIVTSASGCQLLIDNRSRESGAVVVVPSEEWDAMRQASLAASQPLASPETEDTEDDAPGPLLRAVLLHNSKTLVIAVVAFGCDRVS